MSRATAADLSTLAWRAGPGDGPSTPHAPGCRSAVAATALGLPLCARRDVSRPVAACDTSARTEALAFRAPPNVSPSDYTASVRVGWPVVILVALAAGCQRTMLPEVPPTAVSGNVVVVSSGGLTATAQRVAPTSRPATPSTVALETFPAGQTVIAAAQAAQATIAAGTATAVAAAQTATAAVPIAATANANASSTAVAATQAAGASATAHALATATIQAGQSATAAPIATATSSAGQTATASTIGTATAAPAATQTAIRHQIATGVAGTVTSAPGATQTAAAGAVQANLIAIQTAAALATRTAAAGQPPGTLPAPVSSQPPSAPQPLLPTPVTPALPRSP